MLISDIGILSSDISPKPFSDTRPTIGSLFPMIFPLQISLLSISHRTIPLVIRVFRLLAVGSFLLVVGFRLI